MDYIAEDKAWVEKQKCPKCNRKMIFYYTIDKDGYFPVMQCENYGKTVKERKSGKCDYKEEF